MLEALFGNRTAEKVLLHLYHYGEINAPAIAVDYGIAVTPVRKQLERFENGGILVSRLMGKTRVYAFNPKSPWVEPLRAILKIAYDSVLPEEKQVLFGKRRRPRRKGKPVL